MGRPPKRVVKVGDKFGRGEVIDVDIRYGKDGRHRGARLRCGPPCDTVYDATVSGLFAGKWQSCGCLRREVATARITSSAVRAASKAAHTSHGLAGDRRQDYNRWRAMLSRCENPENESYSRYGGRGIKVCKRWHDPALFIRDIDALGPRPPGATLERKDNDGDYEPGNVCWATWSRQTRNQRRWRNGSAIRLPRQGVWISRIQLGTFTTEQEAQDAYLRAAALLTEAGVLS